MRRLLLSGFLIAGLVGFLGNTVQAAENGKSVVPNGVRLTKYIIGVSDLDRSYAFYHALGLELNGSTGLRKPAVLPDGVRKLVDVPAGTKFRNAMLKIPGADFAVEMTEFSDMPLKPGRPAIHDPGAALLILTVRDINAALSAARKTGADIVTNGGTPLSIGPKSTTRAIFLRDPDSFYIELLQPNPLPATTAPDSSNVIAARFGTVVADAEKAAQFYRDRFGLEAKVNDWTSNENLLKLSGQAGGQMRSANVTVPGTTLAWSFFEFKTKGATPYRLRIPDPGAPAIGFQVRDLSAAIDAYKEKGGSVITTGDGRMQNPNGAVTFTRDPNGLLVELAESTSKK